MPFLPNMMSRKLVERVIQHSSRRAIRWGRDSSNMTRLFSASPSESHTPHRRGNLLIGLGWALLGLVVVDQALQYKQEQEATEHRRLLHLMQKEANEENETQWDTSLPSLFQCKISHTEVSLDGTKMLRNIGVGDVVEVLEPDIGPNQAYHLCRNPASNRPGSVGWYPVKFMERLD
jgi:hypothetical protein